MITKIHFRYHCEIFAMAAKFISYIPPTVVVKLLQYSGLGSNTGMGFLCTNDLLLRPKMVNFKFGFLRVVIKNSERYCLEDLNLNQIKCKRSLLEVSGYWI